MASDWKTEVKTIDANWTTATSNNGWAPRDIENIGHLLGGNECWYMVLATLQENLAPLTPKVSAIMPLRSPSAEQDYQIAVKKKADEDAEILRLAQEAAKKKQDEEEAAQLCLAQEAARKKQEEEEAAKLCLAQEAARKKQEEEEAAKLCLAQEAAKKKQEEDEAKGKKKQDDADADKACFNTKVQSRKRTKSICRLKTKLTLPKNNQFKTYRIKLL
jgi:hypothetical protein